MQIFIEKDVNQIDKKETPHTISRHTAFPRMKKINHLFLITFLVYRLNRTTRRIVHIFK